jgi:hypothetical protein
MNGRPSAGAGRAKCVDCKTGTITACRDDMTISNMMFDVIGSLEIVFDL